MICLRTIIQMAIPCALFLSNGSAMASADAPRHQHSLQDMVEQVVNDLVEIKIRDAHNEIQIRIGSDDRDDEQRHDHLRRNERLSYDTLRALKRLDAEHEREIRRLEAELEYQLREAEHDFRRSAKRGHKADKFAHQRNALSKEVDKAYHRFHREMARAVDRYDEQRDRILSRRRGAWPQYLLMKRSAIHFYSGNPCDYTDPKWFSYIGQYHDGNRECDGVFGMVRDP